jgi:alpha-mannosidase
VKLPFDLAAASNDGTQTLGGFDGKGNSLPAEMLPQQIEFNGVQFQLGHARSGSPNALVSRGQRLKLPSGQFNRVYILAASSDGDQEAEFWLGDTRVQLDVQDWGGFIGQWDDRIWVARNHDDYAEMVGIRPGYIKRAQLAWYCSHHHDAAGKNVAYAYSYLFAYSVLLPPGAKSITLPKNDKIRILAITVAEDDPEVRATQPLYDVLPPIASKIATASKQ